ncbi:hypothetical protein LT330_000071 [Penicillium expansum]|nr:hypothetical protein LT330_000071 [Penicillium expansum]
MSTIQLSPIAISLDRSLLESPIPVESQKKIVAHLWCNGCIFQKQHFRPYFQYYTEQCRIAFQSHGSHLIIRTHRHVIDIATRIRDGYSRAEVKQFAQQCQWTGEPTSEDAINASVDLTVRILYMLDVGEFQNTYSGREKLLWAQGPVQKFLHETLLKPVSLEHDGIRLNDTFNVCNMVRIAGFKLELTSNLSDHLRLRDKTISIFHHASFLLANKQTLIFPAGLIDETLATLALIFPRGKKETIKWYSKQNEHNELDENILGCGFAVRQIGEYNYWHDRLVILKTEFDESRPSTIQQWWNDRRDGSQWYPLWVAISLTVLFGLVQSVEGALQVYKAYNP